MKRRSSVSVLLVLAACSRGSAPRPMPAPVSVAVPPGAVAEVGTATIAPSLVALVASARSESPADAARGLVEDALLADGAAARGIDHTPGIAWALAAARARFVLDDARRVAASTAPTDEELRALAAAHWRDVDLPEQYRVVHACVLRPSPSTPEAAARARAVAASIAAAVATATSAEDFESKASGVAHPGLEVRVERLPAFVADGRASEGPPDSAFDPTFAAAAATLKTTGATSDVVETRFGWHVIRLLERLPAHRLSVAEMRARFTDEIRAKLARKRVDDVLSDRRASTRVTTADDADTLIGEIRATGVP